MGSGVLVGVGSLKGKLVDLVDESIKMGQLKGSLSTENALAGKLVAEGALSGRITRSFETYEGPYEVTPSANDVYLETGQSLLVDDVRVLAIPVMYESNPYGGTTVTIGST